MTQTKEQKAELKAAQAAAPNDETLRDIAARVPPLQRDAAHSFVPAEDTDAPDIDATVAQPEADSTITLTRGDPAESTYERSTAFSEVDLEHLTDEQIKDGKVLSKATNRVAPARLAPTSDRPRAPHARVPAAGAGTWPVNESQLPAVMPTDTPLDEHDDQHNPGDATFAKRARLNTNKDGSLSRKGIHIRKHEVSEAAALFLRLRQQFPGFTQEQLDDEFELQWLSNRVGAKQSHRPGAEASPHGLTAVGDERQVEQNLGQQRAKSDAAFEADPQNAAIPPTPVPEAGLPTANEPASTAPDAAKEPSGEAAEADQKAVEQTKEGAKK